jgi:crotonobetaine/carnitine-CoA ligase
MQKNAVTFWTRLPDYYSAKENITALLEFDPKKCKKCDICTFICPARSIIRDRSDGPWNNGYPYLKMSAPDLTDCVACGCCLAACPTGAITIKRGFNAGFYYQRLTQTDELAYPHRYQQADSDGEGGGIRKGPPATDEERPSPETGGRVLRRMRNRLLLGKNAAVGVTKFAVHEIRRARAWSTFKKFALGAAHDISWAQLLEESAAQVPDKTCLLYSNEVYTYRQMDDNANRLANFFLNRKNAKGKGIGLLMRNSPRFLDVFFGAQKIGMYLVPINPELKGDGLAYIVNHSDIGTLVVDAELLGSVQERLGHFQRIAAADVMVDDVETEAQGIPISEPMARLSKAYACDPDNPGMGYDPRDLCLIIYTSGTTGRPKGVVYRYQTSGVQLLALGGNIFFRPDDTYYTYLSLCHGNALFLTVTMSLAVKCTVALSRRFSASRFWDTVRTYDATVFNTIGTIIPILMKQPERPDDQDHRVRVVFSAACPLDMWIPFETRFGVELYEGYGAVDGGGKGIMNLGTAPPGALGKAKRSAIRIVDETGREVPDGMPGELLFKIRGQGSMVEYYKNPDASEKKSGDGWLHTGDIVKRDRKGYLYFVGRNTESMRKGGENVSAYEVEHVIMGHAAVEDVAVYAVPSDLGEDDIMAAVKPVNGTRIDARELRAFLTDKLAKFAVPRYIRVVDEFPKTSTHRVIKSILVQEGVTPDTFDALKASL